MLPQTELIIDRLKQDYIAVDQDWLSECVEYFVDDDPTIRTADLYEKTLEQWRLSDLADIGIACLPETMAEKRTTPVLLNCNYVVQMLSVIDISESAYDQLRRLYNKQIELTDGEKQESKAKNPKKKRSLKLELSDGHRNCFGLEYRPIACLHTKLAPGCKIRLAGPLRCVNGILLLEPHNVHLLGGEVAKYEIDNAFENMLLRQLGRPLNPAPRSDYEEQRVCEEQRDAHNLAALRKQHRQKQLNRTTAAAAAAASSTLNGSNDIFDDDDQMLAGVNLDGLVENEEEDDDDDDLAIVSSAVAAENAIRTIIELPDEDEDDDGFMEIIASLPDEVNAAATTTSTSQTSTNNASSGTKHSTRSDSAFKTASDDYFDEDANEYAAFEDEMQLEDLNAMEAFASVPAVAKMAQKPSLTISYLDSNYPHRMQGCNLISIAQLQRHHTDIKRAHCTPALCHHPAFIVAAVVDSVFEKLQVKPTGWRIGVLVRDASEAGHTPSAAAASTSGDADMPMLRLRLGDAVLSVLTGTTAEELHQMRRQSKDRPQLIETITEILGTLRETLQTLRCFVKLPIDGGTEQTDDGVITVTDLVRSAPVLERILSKKLQAETRNV